MLKKINIPIYNVHLYVHIGIPSNATQKRFNFYISDHSTAETHDIEDGIFVWFVEKKFEAPIVAHEAIHIKNLIYKDISAKHDFDNDEPEAYLTEYIVEQIEKIYNHLK